jgi:hypothetical protein
MQQPSEFSNRLFFRHSPVDYGAVRHQCRGSRNRGGHNGGRGHSRRRTDRSFGGAERRLERAGEGGTTDRRAARGATGTEGGAGAEGGASVGAEDAAAPIFHSSQCFFNSLVHIDIDINGPLREQRRPLLL